LRQQCVPTVLETLLGCVLRGGQALITVISDLITHREKRRTAIYVSTVEEVLDEPFSQLIPLSGVAVQARTFVQAIIMCRYTVL
jgi:hypothetical protein